MKRRDFLKGTLMTAGAVVAGCGSDDGPAQAAPTDTTGGGDTSADAETTLPIKDGAEYYPQSVASGDPRPDGAILWARLFDAARADATLDLTLQVSKDAEFTTLVALTAAEGLTASPAHDHCVKVRLAGLEPATTYYYRFVYPKDDGRYVSRTAKVKTAPADDADVPVRFAFVSCQDYIGRYYNSYARLLQEDIDFFLHLGDYVYETTGNKSFQAQSADRKIEFSDKAGAIVFNEGTDDEYFAARSLSNYRELYKTYRSDKDLQAIHEKAPMIAVWDDHEFSDDSWGDHATYTVGGAEGQDTPRRKAANQAWFEYMPVDYKDAPDFEYDPNAEYGKDITIYRDFGYGKHVHLVMTDLRSYRNDHLVPEDALPGAVAITQKQLSDHVGGVPDFAVPYVDVDAYKGGVYAGWLKSGAKSGGYAEAKIAGLVGVGFINAQLERIKAETGEPYPAIDDTDPTLERGVVFLQLGKSGYHGSLGSRYLLLEDTFRLYANVLWAETKGESERVMGEVQEKWFLDTMKGSGRTWKLWGNEYCLLTHTADLREGFDAIADSFKQKFAILCDDWNGFPNKRDQIVSALAEVPNVVALTGDIHSFWAGTPAAEGGSGKKIVELVGSSISSESLYLMLVGLANSDESLKKAKAAAIAALANQLFMGYKAKEVPNPALGYVKTDANGFSIVECDGAELRCTFHQIDHLAFDARLADVTAAFTPVEFKVQAGASDLYMKVDGAWKKWDMATASWT